MKDGKYFDTFTEEERQKAMTIKALILAFDIDKMDHSYVAHIGYSEEEIELLIKAYDWIHKHLKTKEQ